MEKWKPIDNFPGYHISSQGRVYSEKRGIYLKPFLDGWQYPCVSLCKNGKDHTKKIHRLVAESFIPNPLSKREVNHIDGVKTNNHIGNLEWVTNKENIAHAFNTGLNVRGSYYAGRPRRSIKIVETGETFDTIKDCSRRLGCTSKNIVHCLRRENGTCMGYHLEEQEK